MTESLALPRWRWIALVGLCVAASCTAVETEATHQGDAAPVAADAPLLDDDIVASSEVDATIVLGVPDGLEDAAPDIPTESEPVGPPEEMPPAEVAAECASRLPLEVRIAQLLMPFVYGDALDVAVEMAETFQLGGVILMTWPEGSQRSRLDELAGAADLHLHIAVDEEGGPVQRLRSLGTIASARDVAASMSVDEAETMIAAHAALVSDLGITMVFAPVVDVGPVSGPDTIGSRAFGDDPEVVLEYAHAYVRGWQAAGIVPVLKHFPGHGSASVDSHLAPARTPSLKDLWDRDLLPYAQLGPVAGLGVMVGHLDVPGLTDAEGVPASLSHAAVTDLLRGTLGYVDALVVTDALNMRAITDRYSTEEAAVAALVAGVDIVLYASLSQTESIIARIAESLMAGEWDESSLDAAVGRILVSKFDEPCDELSQLQ